MKCKFSMDINDGQYGNSILNTKHIDMKRKYAGMSRSDK